MKSKIDKVNALMNQALHPNTSTELSRTSAVAAIKIIHKYKLVVVDSNSVTVIESNYDDDMHTVSDPPDPHSTADWIEVKNFKIKMAKSAGKCVSCKSDYYKSEVVAFVFNGGTTHYKCRHYWTTHQS